MSIASMPAVKSSVIMRQQPPIATTPKNPPSQAAKPQHLQHHSAGGLTAAKLTSAGSTPVLDTLI